MSRVAKVPVFIPVNVEVKFFDKNISIKGKNGALIYAINEAVNVKQIDNNLIFYPREGYTNGWALSGTTRSIIKSMVLGVSDGFTKQLQLVGVGYRVTINDNVLHLSLGFSHAIHYILPKGITAECRGQTEIILKSADKQLIGQVAADIRAYRHPDPYKGKGIRYLDEIIRIKEAKKK